MKKATSRQSTRTKKSAKTGAKKPVILWWRKKVTVPMQSFLARRPHRSFRRTLRRDYVRSLRLPGYWSFTFEVLGLLKQHKKLIGGLIIAYALLSGSFVGMSSQDSYTQIRDVLGETGQSVFNGAWGEVGKAGLLLLSGFQGSFAPQLSEAQQLYSGFFVLMIWLTTVWLLRAIMAGKEPRLRDGLYNAGAPIIPTVLVTLLLLIQLLPIALAVIGYSAAVATDFLSTAGVLGMLFWVVAGLLTLLSLYWVSSTFIALIVVTLPGMYPWQAIRTAGDLVVGRRVRILFRLIWLLLSVFVFWVIIAVPVIMLDSWIKSWWNGIDWIPIVPIVLLLISSASAVWAASYVYILYRKVVDDDAAPA